MVCWPRYETLPMLQSSVGKTGTESTPGTVQFNHHIVQTPTITQADSIHKAAMELNKAIKNEPSKNTLEHVDAIIKLRIILQERKQRLQKIPEPEPIEIYARKPNITSKGAATSEGANTIPQYYFRSQALRVAASVIIEETNHVKTFTGPQNFGDPPLSKNQPFKPTINLKYTYLQITHTPLLIRTLGKIGISRPNKIGKIQRCMVSFFRAGTAPVRMRYRGN